MIELQSLRCLVYTGNPPPGAAGDQRRSQVGNAEHGTSQVGSASLKGNGNSGPFFFFFIILITRVDVRSESPDLKSGMRRKVPGPWTGSPVSTRLSPCPGTWLQFS